MHVPAGSSDRRALAAATLYAGALLAGLVVVSFPASGAWLRAAHGLTDAEYGSIFLPQVALAIAGAVAGGAAARRLGLTALLVAALGSLSIAEALLAATALVPGRGAFGIVLAGTAMTGLGFGLLGAPLSAGPVGLFPRRGDTALVAAHAAVGAGFALGPLGFGAAAGMNVWVVAPAALAVATLAVAALAALARLPAPAAESGSTVAADAHPAERAAFWALAAVAVLYAFAEGTFGNWAVVYLQETKGVAPASAALALSVFWAAIVAGRVATTVALLKVRAETIWLALPVGMIAAFLALPHVSGAASGVAIYALAGLACSSFFPLTVGIAAKRFPAHVPWVSSMMIAALMIGVGLGSFVVGPLRERLALERLFELSAGYPLVALAIAAALALAAAPARAPLAAQEVRP